MRGSFRRLRRVIAVAVWATFPATGQAANYSTPGAPDVSSARARIDARDYRGALVELQRVEYTRHPDVYSLMGYSYRKSGNQTDAFAYYRKALNGNPNHLGALEYQGELFIEVGQLDRARDNIAQLKRLCPAGCEELGDLEAAVKDAAKK